MACGYGWVFPHLLGAKMSLKFLLKEFICWWDLDPKGKWASATSLVSLTFTQLTPAASMGSHNQGSHPAASLTKLLFIPLDVSVLSPSIERLLLQEWDPSPESSRNKNRSSKDGLTQLMKGTWDLDWKLWFVTCHITQDHIYFKGLYLSLT